MSINMPVGQFWERINALCGAYDGSVTSGWRSAKRNHDVGGVQTSFHRVGLGADVTLDSIINKGPFMQHADRLGLVALDEGDHIHLQPKE